MQHPYPIFQFYIEITRLIFQCEFPKPDLEILTIALAVIVIKSSI